MWTVVYAWLIARLLFPWSRYIDDVAGLGSPGTPDASPVFTQSGLSADEAAKWNDGQRRAVIAAQNAAVSKHNAFTWQNLQPASMGAAETSLLRKLVLKPNICLDMLGTNIGKVIQKGCLSAGLQGGSGMVSPDKASCMDGVRTYAARKHLKPL